MWRRRTRTTRTYKGIWTRREELRNKMRYYLWSLLNNRRMDSATLFNCGCQIIESGAQIVAACPRHSRQNIRQYLWGPS